MQLYDPPASHGLSSLPRLASAQTRAQSLSRASTTQQCEPSAKWHWQLVQAWTERAMASKEMAKEVMRTIVKTLRVSLRRWEYGQNRLWKLLSEI